MEKETEVGKGERRKGFKIYIISEALYKAPYGVF